MRGKRRHHHDGYVRRRRLLCWQVPGEVWMHPLVRDLYKRFLVVGRNYPHPQGITYVREKVRFSPCLVRRHP
jgi:hypothetical protein